MDIHFKELKIATDSITNEVTLSLGGGFGIIVIPVMQIDQIIDFLKQSKAEFEVDHVATIKVSN